MTMLKARQALSSLAWRVEIALIGAVVLWQAVSSVIYAFNIIKGVFQ